MATFSLNGRFSSSSVSAEITLINSLFSSVSNFILSLILLLPNTDSGFGKGSPLRRLLSSSCLFLISVFNCLNPSPSTSESSSNFKVSLECSIPSISLFILYSLSLSLSFTDSDTGIFLSICGSNSGSPDESIPKYCLISNILASEITLYSLLVNRSRLPSANLLKRGSLKVSGVISNGFAGAPRISKNSIYFVTLKAFGIPFLLGSGLTSLHLIVFPSLFNSLTLVIFFDTSSIK